MNLSTSPAPLEQRDFPAFRAKDSLPAFLLGWGLGAALTFIIHLLGPKVFSDPCRGHTLLSLSVPLLLGPGGLAFTALTWRRPPLAAAGLGLVVASLLPGLFVGARDIGQLRTIGCAGGYIVISAPGTKSVDSVALQQGRTKKFVARIGGYGRQQYPGLFSLKAVSTDPGVTVALAQAQVHAGETFALSVTASSKTPINTYTVGVAGTQLHNGHAVTADASLEINVRP